MVDPVQAPRGISKGEVTDPAPIKGDGSDVLKV